MKQVHVKSAIILVCEFLGGRAQEMREDIERLEQLQECLRQQAEKLGDEDGDGDEEARRALLIRKIKRWGSLPNTLPGLAHDQDGRIVLKDAVALMYDAGISTAKSREILRQMAVRHVRTKDDWVEEQGAVFVFLPALADGSEVRPLHGEPYIKGGDVTSKDVFSDDGVGPAGLLREAESSEDSSGSEQDDEAVQTAKPSDEISAG